MHFRREKVISAQREAGIVHFRREKVISAQREAEIVHFKKEKRISAKSISIKKMHRNGRLEQRRSRYHVL